MNEPTTETTPTAGRERPYTPVHGGQGEAMRNAAAEPLAGRRNGRTREPLTRTERMLVTMFVTMFVTFVTMFASLLAAGAMGFTSLSGQLADYRSETNGQLLTLQRQMHEDIGGLRSEVGKLSERVARIETFLQIHHGPLPGP